MLALDSRRYSHSFADYAQAAEYPEHLEQPKELEDAKSLEVRDVTVLWAGVGCVHALYDVEGRDGHEVDEEHSGRRQITLSTTHCPSSLLSGEDIS